MMTSLPACSVIFDEESSHHQVRSILWMLSIFISIAIMIIFATLLLFHPTSNTIPNHYNIHPNSNNNKNTVCVSGGGFSGFWFTLGRLQNGIIRPTTTTTDYEIGISLHHNNTNDHINRILHVTYTRKEYYCYSSGCLGVVAALSRYSMEDMWNMAYNIQLQWKSGQLDRYAVVTAFVDDLLFGRRQQSATNTSLLQNNSTIRLNPMDLSSLNIITSVKSRWWGVQPSIRTPESLQELRTMLIQTTWIPFAIGNDLWYENHMDGASSQMSLQCWFSIRLGFVYECNKCQSGTT
jgi:hypothetical protein